MREGLLWFDNDQRRTPQDKLDQAGARYLERFGRSANVCHVNPGELFVHPSIRVLPNRAVLKGHFWVGRDEEPSSKARRKTA